MKTIIGLGKVCSVRSCFTDPCENHIKLPKSFLTFWTHFIKSRKQATATKTPTSEMHLEQIL